MVVISAPVTAETGSEQERTGEPFMGTVAPGCGAGGIAGTVTAGPREPQKNSR